MSRLWSGTAGDGCAAGRERDTNTRWGSGGRPRRTGGHSCWQQRQVPPCLRLNSSTERLSFQVFFDVVHTVQTAKKTVVILVVVGNVPVIM